MFSIKSCFSRIFTIQGSQKLGARNTLNRRSGYSNVVRDVNEKVENNLRNKDSIGSEFRIIYRAPILRYVQITYGITFSSLAVIPPVLGYSIVKDGFGVYPITFGEWCLIHSDTELVTAVCAMILVTFQVSYVVFKYPFRIYYNASSGKYIAIYQHILPWKKEKVEFSAGDMKKVEKSYSLWHDSLYAVKNKRAILLEDYFFLPQDFNDMMAFKSIKHIQEK